MSYPWQLVLDEFYHAGHLHIFILSENKCIEFHNSGLVPLGWRNKLHK